MFSKAITVGFVIALGAFAATTQGQSPTPTPDAIRITVSMNADGSRTIYEFDAPHHKATATTKGRDGKLLGIIRYRLDDVGRFASGEVYGPDDQFRFRTVYKYDASGKLSEETQLGQDEAVRNKIVYAYDKSGKQTGYTVFDAAGKVLRRTAGPDPSASPASKRR
jgi:YD repeat-containing protein